MTVLSAPKDTEQLLALLDKADLEPVSIQKDGREVAVLLSTREYERLKAESFDDFDALCEEISTEAQARGLTQEKLAAILAEIDAERRR